MGEPPLYTIKKKEIITAPFKVTIALPGSLENNFEFQDSGFPPFFQQEDETLFHQGRKLQCPENLDTAKGVVSSQASWVSRLDFMHLVH